MKTASVTATDVLSTCGPPTVGRVVKTGWTASPTPVVTCRTPKKAVIVYLTQGRHHCKLVVMGQSIASVINVLRAFLDDPVYLLHDALSEDLLHHIVVGAL